MAVRVELRVMELLNARLCHELISPVGAINNGVELVAEEDADADFQRDAMKLIASSAKTAGHRLNFYRFAYGSGRGSTGKDAAAGLLEGGKVKLEWTVPQAYWGKDWAKLLMNATLLGADSLPRGGVVTVTAGADAQAPAFKVIATGLNARVAEEVTRALKGEPLDGPVDARGIQPQLTYRLAQAVKTGLSVAVREGSVEITGG